MASEIGIQGTFEPELRFYSDETSFSLSGYVNRHIKIYWRTKNSRAGNESPLHDIKKIVS